LFEQFAAHAEKPRFLHQVEFERRIDRFLEGQLSLAHASDVLAKGIRRPFGNADRSQDLLAIVQEHLHLIERLSISCHLAEVFVDPNYETLLCRCFRQSFEAQKGIVQHLAAANGNVYVDSAAGRIVIQAPGLHSYRETGGYAATFDGTSFSTASGAPTSADEPIMESLLGNFPDSVMLQALNGAAIRTVGQHFRTDSGNTSNYSGPYWTLIAFAPTPRNGVAWGQPLQQEVFLAIDENTGMLAEVRRVVQIGNAPPKVTQTQFLQWTQQGGQWFPSQIVRLEAGTRTLSFAVQSASVGAAVATTAFQP